MQEVIQKIVADVEGNKTLSSAFSKHPEVFNKIYIALVTAGEASGTLDEALKRIAAQQEKDAAMLSKIRGAMIYPAIVLVVMVAVMLFMIFTIVPQVEKLYSDMKETLPFLTAVLISISNFMIKFWWLMLIILAVIAYFARQYFKTDAGIRTLDTIKLNMPPFNGMMRRLYMARFTRTGQTLLATGVPMLDMLKISSEAVNNVIVSEEITRAAGKVQSCHKIIFCGLSDSYEQFYQAVRRCYRFGQTKPVDVHIIISKKEINALRNIQRKAKQAETMDRQMMAITREVNLSEIRQTNRQVKHYNADKSLSFAPFLKGTA